MKKDMVLGMRVWVEEWMVTVEEEGVMIVGGCGAVVLGWGCG